MKLDKETIIKHRFWFLSGAVVPLFLIATLVLIFGVQKGIAKLRKEVEADRDAPNKFKRDQVRNQKWKSMLTEQERKVDKVLTEVWAEGWNLQAPLVTWPANVRKRFTSDLFATKIKVSKAPPPAGNNQGNAQGGDTAAQASPEDSYLHRGLVRAVDDRQFSVGVQKPQAKGKPVEVVETFYITPDTRLTPEGSTEQPVENFRGKLKSGDQVEVTFVRGKFFGDDFILQERELYKDGYVDQVAGLTDYLQNARGDRVVIAKGGMVELKRKGRPSRQVPKVFQFKKSAKDWPESNSHLDSENIWFAQEDIWVQRELLRAIRTANRYVSQMKTAEGKTFNPLYTREKTNYWFTNPTWQLRLQRTGGKITAEVQNISSVQQQRDVSFKVQVTDPTDDAIRPRTIEINFTGEDLLGPGEHMALPAGKEAEGEITGLYAAEQVLTPATVPVKRVDLIELAKKSAHSQRTIKDLKTRFIKDKKEEVKPAADAAEQGDNKQKIAGIGLGNQKKEDKEPPGSRYTDSTEQFRKMPVAIVLIVDQDSANYVLAALEESKLRFQITQITLTRFTGKIKDEKDTLVQSTGRSKQGFGSQAPDRYNAGGSGSGSPSYGDPRAGGYGSGSGGSGGPSYADPRTGGYGAGSRTGSGGTPFQPAAPVGGGGSGGFGGEQGPTMELVIYGFATIYERYPPKPAAAINAALPQQEAAAAPNK